MSIFIEVEYTKSEHIIAKIDGTGGYITRASLDHLKRNGTLSNVSNTHTTIKIENWALWGLDNLTKKLLGVRMKDGNKILDDNVLEYHRIPTQKDIDRGYGAIHYKDFDLSLCVKKDGTIKKWLVCKEDKLRYYR